MVTQSRQAVNQQPGFAEPKPRRRTGITYGLRARTNDGTKSSVVGHGWQRLENACAMGLQAVCTPGKNKGPLP